MAVLTVAAKGAIVNQPDDRDRSDARAAGVPNRSTGDAARVDDGHGGVERTGRHRKNTILWLGAGGALALLMAGFFVFAFTLQTVLPIVGLVLTGALYGAMVASAFLVPDGRTRLRVLASLMGALAVTMFACGILFYFLEASEFLVPGGPAPS